MNTDIDMVVEWCWLKNIGKRLEAVFKSLYLHHIRPFTSCSTISNPIFADLPTDRAY